METGVLCSMGQTNFFGTVWTTTQNWKPKTEKQFKSMELTKYALLSMKLLLKLNLGIYAGPRLESLQSYTNT